MPIWNFFISCILHLIHALQLRTLFSFQWKRYMWNQQVILSLKFICVDVSWIINHPVDDLLCNKPSFNLHVRIKNRPLWPGHLSPLWEDWTIIQTGHDMLLAPHSSVLDEHIITVPVSVLIYGAWHHHCSVFIKSEWRGYFEMPP